MPAVGQPSLSGGTSTARPRGLPAGRRVLHGTGARPNLKAIFGVGCFNASPGCTARGPNLRHRGSCQQSSSVPHPFPAPTPQTTLEPKLFFPGVFAVVEVEAATQITAKTARCLLEIREVTPDQKADRQRGERRGWCRATQCAL